LWRLDLDDRGPQRVLSHPLAFESCTLSFSECPMLVLDRLIAQWSKSSLQASMNSGLGRQG